MKRRSGICRYIGYLAAFILLGCEKDASSIPASAIVGSWSYSGSGANVLIHFAIDGTYRQVVTVSGSGQQLVQTGRWNLDSGNRLEVDDIFMYDMVDRKWVQKIGVWRVSKDQSRRTSIRGGTVNDPDYDVTFIPTIIPSTQ